MIINPFSFSPNDRYKLTVGSRLSDHQLLPCYSLSLGENFWFCTRFHSFFIRCFGKYHPFVKRQLERYNSDN